MQIYKACVTNKKTRKLVIIESEYRTKKEFINDLRDKGFSVNPYDVKTKIEFDRINESFI